MNDVLFLDGLNDQLTTVHPIGLERYLVPAGMIEMKSAPENKRFESMFQIDHEGKCRVTEYSRANVTMDSNGEETAFFRAYGIFSLQPD